MAGAAATAGAPGTAAAALHLLPHDAVFIRRDPAYTEPAFVVVEGEVRFPGAYAIMRRDERVSDLVRRAGGLTAFGYASGATFTRDGRSPLAVDLPRALRRANDPNNIVVQSLAAICCVAMRTGPRSSIGSRTSCRWGRKSSSRNSCLPRGLWRL